MICATHKIFVSTSYIRLNNILSKEVHNNYGASELIYLQFLLPQLKCPAEIIFRI